MSLDHWQIDSMTFISTSTWLYVCVCVCVTYLDLVDIIDCMIELYRSTSCISIAVDCLILDIMGW